MNFEKCGFCRQRISKTARLDAMYCSAKCRMNALRVRKREERMAVRAAAKAKEANANEGQARLQSFRAAFLVRVQGARLAAAKPNLVEDPWLNLRAEVSVCDKLIAHYTEKKKYLQAQLERMTEPHMSYHYREVTPSEELAIADKATKIGVAMQPGDYEGDAMVYVGSPCARSEHPEKSCYWTGRSKFEFGPTSGR